jgi:hypothetical protein
VTAAEIGKFTDVVCMIAVLKLADGKDGKDGKVEAGLGYPVRRKSAVYFRRA